MAYVCGFINTETGDSFHFEPPEELAEMYPWEGELVGSETNGNGLKGKLDYNGNLWFLLTDDPSAPRLMYLVRATRLSDTEVEYAYIELADELSLPRPPMPNQITIDKNGVVFLQGGSYNANVGALVIKVDPNEDPWAVESNDFIDYTGCLCATLNRDHSRIAYYMQSDDARDRIYILNTATTGVLHYYNMPEGFLQESPFNMETDVSGVNDESGNEFGYMLIGQGVNNLFSFLFADPWSFIFRETSGSDYELVLAVASTTGNVYTMERQKRCPGAPNRVYQYIPAGSIMPGELNDPTIVSITCPREKSKHHDIRRSQSAYDIWIASGESSPPTQGEVIQINALVQKDWHTHTGYRQIFTACPREEHD